jgi:hypothetical protein
MINRPQDKSPLMTVNEAADYLRLSIPTLNRYRVNGCGPMYQKIGPRRVFYDRQDLEAWRASRRRRATCEVS